MPQLTWLRSNFNFTMVYDSIHNNSRLFFSLNIVTPSLTPSLKPGARFNANEKLFESFQHSICPDAQMLYLFDSLIKNTSNVKATIIDTTNKIYSCLTLSSSTHNDQSMRNQLSINSTKPVIALCFFVARKAIPVWFFVHQRITDPSVRYRLSIHSTYTF